MPSLTLLMRCPFPIIIESNCSVLISSLSHIFVDTFELLGFVECVLALALYGSIVCGVLVLQMSQLIDWLEPHWCMASREVTLSSSPLLALIIGTEFLFWPGLDHSQNCLGVNVDGQTLNDIYIFKSQNMGEAPPT